MPRTGSRPENRRIVGIGACVADTLYRIPVYPREDTKLKADDSKTAGGGPVATGLVAAQQLGMQTAYIGNLSDDGNGRFLQADFERFGVRTDLVRFFAGYRSFTSVLWLSADTGTRTCVFDRGNLPPLTLDEEQKKAIASAGLLMVDGNELDAAIEAAALARECGVPVLYDCGGLYPGVERLLALTDLMIPSEEFALTFTGCKTTEAAAKRLYAEFNPEAVVVTEGKRGGIFHDGKTITRYPAYRVDVIDSNGSGDVFHGAFAAGYQKGYSLGSCCRFASAVSALKCTGYGARDSVPSFDRVCAFMKENGYEL